MISFLRSMFGGGPRSGTSNHPFPENSPPRQEPPSTPRPAFVPGDEVLLMIDGKPLMEAIVLSGLFRWGEQCHLYGLLDKNGIFHDDVGFRHIVKLTPELKEQLRNAMTKLQGDAGS